MSRRSETNCTSDGNTSEEHQTGRWTAEEHERFLIGLRKHNKQWKLIADLIRTRTVVQVRTHAQKHFQKLARQQAQSKSEKCGYDSLNDCSTSVKSQSPLQKMVEDTVSQSPPILSSAESVSRKILPVVPPSPQEHLFAAREVQTSREFFNGKAFFGFDGVDYNSMPAEKFSNPDTISQQFQLCNAALARRCNSTRSFPSSHFPCTSSGFSADFYDPFPRQHSTMVPLSDPQQIFPVASNSSSSMSWVDCSDLRDSTTLSGVIYGESDFDNTEGLMDLDLPFSDDMFMSEAASTNSQLFNFQMNPGVTDDCNTDIMGFDFGFDLNSLEPFPLSSDSSSFIEDDCDVESIVNCLLNPNPHLP